VPRYGQEVGRTRKPIGGIFAVLTLPLFDLLILLEDYEGDYCETSSGLIEGHNLCSNDTCVNGGFCTSIVEVCECPPNFEGDLCEIPVGNLTNATATAPLGNATAHNGVNDTILDALRRLEERRLEYEFYKD